MPTANPGAQQRGHDGRRAPRRHASFAAASAASVVALFIIASTALGATGDLTQKVGTDGCISETGTSGDCGDGVALNGATSVTVSPDGTSAYAASDTSNAVTVFDRQATPETTIDSGPSGTTDENSPTFTFTSDTSDSSSECQVNNGAWVECSSPFTTFALADGSNRFRVRSIDGADNVGAAASSEFTVDTLAPITTITSGPQGLTGEATASFGFVSNETGSSFDCLLDSAAFSPCSSPHAYTGLADGDHSFEVRATDPAGNVGAAASREFTVAKEIDGSASAKTTQKQKGSKVKVKVKVKAGEQLSAEGSGKVRVKLNGKERSYKLKPKSKDVAAGAKKNLTLKPKKSSDRKKIVKALKQGEKPKAKLTIKLTDELGNTASTKLSVKLKG